MAAPRTYYNEFDPHAARWLRNLCDAGLITPGTVDGRDVKEVKADELRSYDRCHFFAGIGGWDHALALAGFPAARPVWTASCPCQPFSTAGKGEGEEDARHLWPVLSALVRERQPDCIFGEQVASSAGYEWLDGVRSDLEAEGYAFGAADLPACCAGAPHVRQRLFWVATARNACGQRQPERDVQLRQPQHAGQALHRQPSTARRGAAGTAPDADGAGFGERGGAVAAGAPLATAFSGGETGRPRNTPQQRPRDAAAPDAQGAAGRRAAEPRHASLNGSPSDALGVGWREGNQDVGGGDKGIREEGHGGGSADDQQPGGFWDAYDVLDYRDGKRRRVEPGTFPLAHGVPARLVKLRGYGNAVVAPVAALFVRAYLETEGGGI